MDADLDEGLDIRVVKGSAIPRSPAAIKAEAAQAWEMGFMVDRFGRPDFRRMQEVFELGTAEELYAEDEINTQNARAVQDVILSLPPEMALVVLQQFEQTGSFRRRSSRSPKTTTCSWSASTGSGSSGSEATRGCIR